MNRTIKFRAWDNKNKKWITEVPYKVTKRKPREGMNFRL